MSAVKWLIFVTSTFQQINMAQAALLAQEAPKAPWPGARLRLSTPKDSFFKPRGVEYRWIHEWVIPIEGAENASNTESTLGWSCLWCDTARKRMLVQRMREHIAGCEKVRRLRCDALNCPSRAFPILMSDLPLQAPKEVTQKAMELLGAVVKKKAKDEQLEKLDQEGEESRKGAILEKHRSIDIRVRTSSLLPSPFFWP
jgi:hypothetical protein